LSRNTPDFISPLLWTLNSPDLIPVDYEVWGVLQQRDYIRLLDLLPPPSTVSVALAPAYFKHVCTPVSDISGRAHLRSAERRDMLVPRTRTELGRQSFPVAAPTVWNSLPAHLRSIGRRQFRDGLKSHLFADAYF